MNVEVAWVGPDFSALVALDLADGATVADAVAASGLLARIAKPGTELAYAVFGRSAAPSRPLAEGDRVEMTRPLVVDPATRRRLLAAKRGAAR